MNFSQQLDFSDDEDLAEKLKMQPGEIRKFEVFVSVLCDGNIDDALSDPFKYPDLDQIKEIIDQLLGGLKQLKRARVCHNDIKPGNILYCLVGNKYDIRIADFGQCNKKGGTPGWTAPIFTRKRTPGKEDMFSMGLIILRVLSNDQDLFYALRDNWVNWDNLQSAAKRNFNNMPEIKLVIKMMDLDNQPSIQDAENEWKMIKSNVQTITLSRLNALGVSDRSLKLQYNHSR